MYILLKKRKFFKKVCVVGKWHEKSNHLGCLCFFKSGIFAQKALKEIGHHNEVQECKICTRDTTNIAEKEVVKTTFSVLEPIVRTL